MSETPANLTPRLRNGHLLDGNVEIDALLRSGKGYNAYTAFCDSRLVLVLEYSDPPLEEHEIPEPCRQFFPKERDRFTHENRHYTISQDSMGSLLTHISGDCWEPEVLELIAHMARLLLTPPKYGLDTCGAGPDDIFLTATGPLWLIPPRQLTTTAGDSELSFREIVKDLLFKRLMPGKTRNLEQPLHCLALSDRTEELFTRLLDGSLDTDSFANTLFNWCALPEPHWDVAGATDRGLTRGHNEDAFGKIAFTLRSDVRYWRCWLLAVADGMGGHHAGELASHHVLSCWLERVFRALGPGTAFNPNNAKLRELVNESFYHAQEQMLDPAAIPEGFRTFGGGADRPGSTLVAGILTGRLLFLGHCGDSRAYRFNGERLERLTRDHSLVQRYIDTGDLTEEEAFGHDQGNVILNFMGIDQKSFFCDLSVHRLNGGDSLLLCSDGLTGMVPEARIAEILTEASGPAGACRALILAAREAGGEDNITVQVASVT